MTLHIVSQSPYQGSALEECLEIIAPDDEILLIGEGVYACQGPICDKLATHPLYALEPDLLARGIKTTITGIDYQRFVELTVIHPHSISWF